LEDLDDDNDTVEDSSDDCSTGDLGWTSNSATDYDDDGCQDSSSEDLDDDNDSVLDGSDDCQKGDLNWSSWLGTDYDSDGCLDSSTEDLDDDNDSVLDEEDDCSKGSLNWLSNPASDFDSDGCEDSTEDFDDDSDGFEDVIDYCPLIPGTSTNDRNGCIDSDGDGWSDSDANWDWMNGADNFVSDATQWSDYDQDGYGDNPSGADPDYCQDEFGTSWQGEVLGCLDSDGDGWADIVDAFPEDGSRYIDDDLDGYDDEIEDDCLQTYGISRFDRTGCPDTDQDGWSDPDSEWPTSSGSDAFPQDSTQWADFDEDGYGDNPDGELADDCTDSFGESVIDRMGCPDSDNDGRSDPDQDWGVSEGADALPLEATQWQDLDGDGFGDDPAGERYDSCNDIQGTSYIDYYGCIDSDEDGIRDSDDKYADDPTRWYNSDDDQYDDLSDDCPYAYGTSIIDRTGCPDTDGDGISNADAYWSTADGADKCPDTSADFCLAAVPTGVLVLLAFVVLGAIGALYVPLSSYVRSMSSTSTKPLPLARRCGICGRSGHDRRTCPDNLGKGSKQAAPVRTKPLETKHYVQKGTTPSGKTSEYLRDITSAEEWLNLKHEHVHSGNNTQIRKITSTSDEVFYLKKPSSGDTNERSESIIREIFTMNEWYSENLGDLIPEIVFESKDPTLLVMGGPGEFTLGQCIGQFSYERKVSFLRDLAVAIQCIHDGGYVHRDIKPANITVSDVQKTTGPVLHELIDLGLAMRLNKKQGKHLGITPFYGHPTQDPDSSKCEEIRTHEGQDWFAYSRLAAGLLLELEDSSLVSSLKSGSLARNAKTRVDSIQKDGELDLILKIILYTVDWNTQSEAESKAGLGNLKEMGKAIIRGS